MQFWSGTAFMNATEAMAAARMLDDAGFDGVICSDHLIYPRELASPYPVGDGQAHVVSGYRVAQPLGVDRCHGGRDKQGPPRRWRRRAGFRWLSPAGCARRSNCWARTSTTVASGSTR